MAFRADFTTLRIFVAVAETRNLTRAAEREHIAASAVSKRLSDLEHMLGAQLLYRLPRGVDLTPAGEALHRHALTMLQAADRLASDLGDYSEGVKGHVRMLANRSSVVAFLPKDLSAFSAKHPGISVDLREDNSDGVLKAVIEGQTDVGVFTAAGDDTKFCHTFPYNEDRYVLVVPGDHPLAEREKVTFEDVRNEYFIGLELQSAWNATIERAAAQAGMPLRMRFRLKSTDAILTMVAQGLGVTVTTFGLFSAIHPNLNLKALHLDEPWASRQLMVAVRDLEGLPTPARLMVEHLSGQSLAGALATVSRA